MGASAKRKKEKKKDFQKPKLKVGKTAPRASNFTDTSFKAKSITLTQQSLRSTAPSPTLQFTHHLSLLSSHSDNQTRDSLAYLTSVLHTTPTPTLPLPFTALLTKLLPLLTRPSPSLRTQLLKLLRALPALDVRDHVEHCIRYIRVGLTHLAADVRADSVEALSWLLDVAGAEAVSCRGGWVRLTKAFLALFGWEAHNSTTASTTARLAPSNTATSIGKSPTEQRALARQFHVFAALLQTGIGLPATPSSSSTGLSPADSPSATFPLTHHRQHLLPTRSNPYAHLALFASTAATATGTASAEAQPMDERSERQKVIGGYRGLIAARVEEARRSAGEVGRAAGRVGKVLEAGMADVDADGDGGGDEHVIDGGGNT
ncbi:MAG: hypothetical protein M1833_006253 [Piccolia ochrophora]|nr:MAG: hypothetical protein M1833_006253 [Piccolia ochrophora]